MKETAMPDAAPGEDTPRALAVTLAIWAAAVALGAADGVFARLGLAVDEALAAFAAVFALATYALDASVRGAVDRVPAALLLVAALVPDAGLALAIQANGAQALVDGPLALLGFFGIPVALVAHAAALLAVARPRLRSRAGRPPGARPAAT